MPRVTAARQALRRAFDQPLFFKQLFGDERDGAALQAGEPCEIGARNLMTQAHQIEQDAAIDFARRLIAGRLNPVLLQFSRTHILTMNSRSGSISHTSVTESGCIRPATRNTGR